MTITRLSLALGTMTLLLVGCGKTTADTLMENEIEKQTGGEATVDTSDGTMHVETSEGTFDMGGNTVPADWPTDVPVYAGATVQYSAAVNPETGEVGLMVVLSTNDSVETVVAFYQKALQDNGWTLDGTLEGQGTTILAANKADRTVGLSVAGAGDTTSVTIGVGKK